MATAHAVDVAIERGLPIVTAEPGPPRDRPGAEIEELPGSGWPPDPGKNREASSRLGA